MFKTEELNSLSKSLEHSIDYIENYLDKYNEYLSYTEKMEMLKELENYKAMEVKIESLIGKQELERILE